jgi:hypothetical protein
VRPKYRPHLEILEDRLGPAGPTITSQPVGQIVDSGQTATLSVAAAGTGLSYQWYSCAENTFYANSVVNYSSGALQDPTYNDPSAALGGLFPGPESFTYGGTTYNYWYLRTPSPTRHWEAQVYGSATGVRPEKCSANEPSIGE